MVFLAQILDPDGDNHSCDTSDHIGGSSLYALKEKSPVTSNTGETMDDMMMICG